MTVENLIRAIQNAKPSADRNYSFPYSLQQAIAKEMPERITTQEYADCAKVIADAWERAATSPLFVARGKPPQALNHDPVYLSILATRLTDIFADSPVTQSDAVTTTKANLYAAYFNHNWEDRIPTQGSTQTERVISHFTPVEIDEIKADLPKTLNPQDYSQLQSTITQLQRMSQIHSISVRYLSDDGPRLDEVAGLARQIFING